MNAEPHKQFIVTDTLEQLRQYYEQLRDYSLTPELIFNYHESIGSIEWLIAENLAAPYDHLLPRSQPEQRALVFLRQIHHVLGIEPGILARHLYVKHTYRSQMGIHCILELRNSGKEINETNFVVHFDHQLAIVMVSGVYQRNIECPEPPQDDVAGQLEEKIASELNKEHKILQTNQVDYVWEPDWENGCYRLYLHAKVSTTKGPYTVLVAIDKTEKAGMHYPIKAKNQHTTMSISKTYIGFWSKEDNEIVEPSVADIILRDFKSGNGMLRGKYVEVIDRLNPLWRMDGNRISVDKASSSSHFDRIMAYYHIDKVQRYFRELGLTILDEYEALNPIQVILYKGYEGSDGMTYYDPVQTSIFLNLLPGAYHKDEIQCFWTDARVCQILYHEFTHAVTDTICRLQRQNKANTKNPRFRNMLQAAAMDEGMADYFACSLAARDGATRPTLGRLKVIREDQDDESSAPLLVWEIDDTRTLDALELDLTIPLREDLSSIERDDSKKIDELIYSWARQWSNYLWHLHRKLGSEIADRLIAHSIFFLTRWSSFSMGVWALILADRLLFNGVHEKIIQEQASIETSIISESSGFVIRSKIARSGDDQSTAASEDGISFTPEGEQEEAQIKDKQFASILPLGERYSTENNSTIHEELELDFSQTVQQAK